MSKRGKKCGVARLSPEGVRSATGGEKPFDIHIDLLDVIRND